MAAYGRYDSAKSSERLTTKQQSQDDLKHAVEAQHGGKATLANSVALKDVYSANLVWDGVVHVFDLEGHPEAPKAYAWSPVDSETRQRVFAMLHAGSIQSPLDAVRAAIGAEHRAN